MKKHNNYPQITHTILSNKKIVESAENLIYENSELYKNLKEKEQECEQIKEKYEALKLENQEGYEIVDELKQECEKLKKQLMQKSEVDIFFNTPIEGWSSDPCDICKFKNCLTEIKEVASKVLLNTHDLEQFKDADALFGALLEIHKKISECEVNNN